MTDRRRAVALLLAKSGPLTVTQIASACGFYRHVVLRVLHHHWFECVSSRPAARYGLTAEGRATWADSVEPASEKKPAKPKKRTA
jgi:hypothetical protein